MSSPFLHSKTGDHQAGFGLIELMVSISIMVIIMGVVLIRQDSFNGAVLLRGEAYEIALAVRSIQQSAVSASGRSTTVGGTVDEFRTVLGAHFTTAEPNRYAIFQDDDGDNYFDTGEELGQQGTIDPRFFVSAIRRGNGTPETAVSVVFERPNFDARFFDAANSEMNTTTLEIDIARVGGDQSGLSEVRTITITRAGQITVE